MSGKTLFSDKLGDNGVVEAILDITVNVFEAEAEVDSWIAVTV